MLVPSFISSIAPEQQQQQQRQSTWNYLHSSALLRNTTTTTTTAAAATTTVYRKWPSFISSIAPIQQQQLRRRRQSTWNDLHSSALPRPHNNNDDDDSLHGMNFPVVSDRSPLWIPADQTLIGHFFSQNYRHAIFSVPCCCLHPSHWRFLWTCNKNVFRPDISVMVDWVLKTNCLSVYHQLTKLIYFALISPSWLSGH